jgi:hypothetical protein
LNALPASLSTHCSCNEALCAIRESLSRRGLRALETFDLQDARAGNEDCGCPQHGAAPCDCQMIVLMVYGEGTAPSTLTLHGTGGQVWITLVENAAHEPDAQIVAAVREAVTGSRAAQGL